MAVQVKSESQISQIIDSIKDFINYQFHYIDNDCFRRQINKQYKDILVAKEKDAPESKSLFTPFATTKQKYAEDINNFDINKVYVPAAHSVYTSDLPQSQSNLQECLRQDLAKTQNAAASKQTPQDTTVLPNYSYQSSPFDRRLDRESISVNNQPTLKTPMSTRFAEPATVGFLVAEQTIRNNASQANVQQLIDQRDAQQKELIKNNYYIGVPSLINTYALTKLYGSAGGQKLVNKKNERRWYEVDSQIGDTANSQIFNYASNPTTSAIISWGNGDPYGRTPYHFTDFVFCKHWNKIANNRMITLRRFAAPILDNMKFPGMDGTISPGSPSSVDVSANTRKIDDGVVDDGGSGSKVTFPPMATAVTYFGEETGNTLSSILKFTTGYKWDDVQASVWDVTSESTPEADAGPGKLYKGLTSVSKMLNIASGNWGGSEQVANLGNMPPDPYVNGPYENRIKGPVNRIDSVKKRKPGLEFKMDGINLVFEYVARPVGGVNPKAVLLDIMSNFFIIGSASAVFFGGQHRFMGNPAKYPFLGGDKGIEKWYRGDPIGWAEDSVKSFSHSAQVGGVGLWESAKAFFGSLFGGGASGAFGSVEGLFSSSASNVIKNAIASKTAGQVPYLSGLRALLIGEPTGEWHITLGAPTNPVALIGNLICTTMDVEFNDELGPDDFPTEMKVTVHLDHAMARDRDAIESLFNRGMGRIYSVPDSFRGTADGQTHMDNATKNNDQTGTMPDARHGFIATSGTLGRTMDKPATVQNQLHGNVSVWNRSPFYSGLSPNVNETDDQIDDMFRSQYRQVDWVGLRSLT